MIDKVNFCDFCNWLIIKDIFKKKENFIRDWNKLNTNIVNKAQYLYLIWFSLYLLQLIALFKDNYL